MVAERTHQQETQPVLHGIRVVDLSWGIAGPITSMMLSDNGAEVIKVEPPAGDPFRREPGYLVWNRGKKSLAVDLKQPEGQALLRDLVQGADLLLESFSPGVAERLGAGYEALAALNPRLIYCSISGYGPRGAHHDKPGYDHLVAARTGVYEQPGFRPGPTFVVFPLPSFGAALLAVQGIGVALYVREVTGKGQKIETSLFAGSLSMQPHLVAGIGTGTGMLATVMSSRNPFGVQPFYRLYQCRDDRWLQFGCINVRFVQRAARVMDLEEVMVDPKYGDGRTIPTPEARDELVEIVAAKMRERTYAEWAAIFDEADVPYAPTQLTEEYMEDPQVVHSQQVVDVVDPVVGPMKQPGLPLVFRGNPGRVQGPAPRIGEHTEEVLLGLDYSKARIQKLREGSVIAVADA